MGRANASVPPPAGKGTIRFTGLEGQLLWAWAHRGSEPVTAAKAFKKSRRWPHRFKSFMSCLLVLFRDSIIKFFANSALCRVSQPPSAPPPFDTASERRQHLQGFGKTGTGLADIQMHHRQAATLRTRHVAQLVVHKHHMFGQDP